MCVCVCVLPGSWHWVIQSPGLKSCFSPEWDFYTLSRHTQRERQVEGRVTDCAGIYVIKCLINQSTVQFLTNILRQKQPRAVSGCASLKRLWYLACRCAHNYPHWLQRTSVYTRWGLPPVLHLTQLLTNSVDKQTYSSDFSPWASSARLFCIIWDSASWFHSGNQIAKMYKRTL